MFGVTARTVSRWAKAGRLPHIVTPGGHVRFRRSDLEPFLRFSADTIEAGDGATSRSAPETKGSTA
jgi:excisionase family DNA binding protein